MFAKQIIIAGAFLAALSTAAPTSNGAAEIDVPGGLKIIDITESAAGVQLVWYGDADTASTANSTTDVETSSLSRRCGSNRTKCFNDNQAAASACEALINGLLTSNNALPTSPRSVCATTSGNQCCTSWADNLSGARINWLHNAAEALDGCRASRMTRLSAAPAPLNACLTALMAATTTKEAVDGDVEGKDGVTCDENRKGLWRR